MVTNRASTEVARCSRHTTHLYSVQLTLSPHTALGHEGLKWLVSDTQPWNTIVVCVVSNNLGHKGLKMVI